MDNRPIGVFDSGLGGISVLCEALKQLPNENFAYYGDTKHIPYGDKSPEDVLRFTHLAMDELLSLGCKAIVIACNTATAVAAKQLRRELDLPIIGMEPALKPASLIEREGSVLVMATRLTLSQPKFLELMQRCGQDAVPVPCPGLMQCVEAGELSGEHVNNLLSTLLKPHLDKPVKAVVLGCTHYVFLKKTIASFFPPDVALIDGNEGTIRQLRHRLADADLLCNTQGSHLQFLSSMHDEETPKLMQKMLNLCAKSA
ncbi:MAG: glutamate racemase [Clostridia bacterium]